MHFWCGTYDLVPIKTNMASCLNIQTDLRRPTCFCVNKSNENEHEHHRSLWGFSTDQRLRLASVLF